MAVELRELEALLQEKLHPTQKIKGFSTRSLTLVGDNYGSTMLALTVALEDSSTGDQDQLELVAKMVPSNPDFYKMFQVEETFVKESSIYTIVAPTLRAFQREKGVPEDQLLDSFVDCWGSRTSLDPEKKALDSDAVLILENLKFKGFTVGDRSKGFNLKHSEFILKNLASFHAVLIAYRKERPEECKEKILPYLNKLDMDAGVGEQSMKEMLEVI